MHWLCLGSLWAWDQLGVSALPQDLGSCSGGREELWAQLTVCQPHTLLSSGSTAGILQELRDRCADKTNPWALVLGRLNVLSSTFQCLSHIPLGDWCPQL